jgi:hypothetical protein
MIAASSSFVPLNPAIDSGVIQRQTPFGHHFFQISIAERKAQIPPDCQKDDVGLKMPPFERIIHVSRLVLC